MAVATAIATTSFAGLRARMDRMAESIDVYLLQSTSPPVEQHLVELLPLADACRRAGAARLTAVIP